MTRQQHSGSRLTPEGRARLIAAQHRRKGQPWNKWTQEQRFRQSERHFARRSQEAARRKDGA